MIQDGLALGTFPAQKMTLLMSSFPRAVSRVEEHYQCPRLATPPPGPSSFV